MAATLLAKVSEMTETGGESKSSTFTHRHTKTEEAALSEVDRVQNTDGDADIFWAAYQLSQPWMDYRTGLQATGLGTPRHLGLLSL